MKEIKFQPIPKRVATRIWHRARDFDRKTSKAGCHGGAVGHAALQVLHSLIFDFLNYRTGRLDPSYEGIARKANLARSTVAEAPSGAASASPANDPLVDLGVAPEVPVGGNAVVHKPTKPESTH